MGSASVAILPGPRTSFLDHLVPLCHLMKMPLLITDPLVYHTAQIFYPDTELLLSPHSVEPLSSFDQIYSVEPSRLHPKAFQFGNHLFRGEQRSICGLHGNSDKNRTTFWIERYVDEDVVLLYGNFMLDFLREKGVLHRIKRWVRTGNYRLQFYQQHEHFFDALMEPHLFTNRRRKTILYAPTWSYPPARGPNDSPFFQQIPFILDHIPQDFQVIVKLHPFMFRLFPHEVETLKKKYEQSDQISFLDEIPLIYPILKQTDIYLGDYSSVGYDFLAMNRPLFFLTEGQITKAGRCIQPEEYHKLYQIMDDPCPHHEPQRKELYHYVFGEPREEKELREEICAE